MMKLTADCLDAVDRWYAHSMPPRTKRSVSIRVFKNGFVENVFGKSHPITPIVWFGPFIAYGIYGIFAFGHPMLSFAYFALGVLAFSLVEYLLHRFLFHWKPEWPWIRSLAFLWHGYHHEFPQDAMRLVAPPLMSWPVAVATFFLSRALLGADWSALFAGMCTGYLAYDWIHYYCHHFRPTGGIGKFLRDYHLQHHFDTRPGRFGVSSPLWDVVFGTYLARRVAKAQQPASES